MPRDFRPQTGTMEEWNAAYVRVEDYLRAHRIDNRRHQSRLIQQVLERAARRHAVEPGLSPTVIAAEETEAMMDDWFAEMLDVRGQSHERIAVEGRLALLLSDGPQRWPILRAVLLWLLFAGALAGIFLCHPLSRRRVLRRRAGAG